MISESDEHQRASDRAHLAWGFLLSLPITLVLWVLLGLVFVRNDPERALFTMAQQPPELLTSTSIVHMERRPVPEPKREAAQPPLPVPRPAAMPERAEVRAQPTPETRPTEIARENPTAPPQAQSSKTHQQAASLSEVLAQQNAAFQREAQQLNANRAPLSNATIDPNSSPHSQVSYHMDISEMRTTSGPGFGYLTPLKGWTDRGYHCYYGHYDWQYPDGGTESANIPWAFCYPPREDPVARGLRQFPFPLPLPGYRLPPDTQLEPVEKRVYELWLQAQQP